MPAVTLGTSRFRAIDRRPCLPMMSDMSTPLTFTSRDLNRQPAKVLGAARRLGSVEIRTRNGEAFTLSCKKATPKLKKLPDFEARRRRLVALGCVPWPASETEKLNRIIAGED